MLPRSLIAPIVLAFIALNLVGQALPLYTDYLWFQEVKFTSVFTTRPRRRLVPAQGLTRLETIGPRPC